MFSGKAFRWATILRFNLHVCFYSILFVPLACSGLQGRAEGGIDIHDRPATAAVPSIDTLTLEIGEWDQAINIFNKQLEQYPDSGLHYYYLGLAYYNKAMSSRGKLNRSSFRGMLGSNEVAWLSEALQNFNSTVDLEPSDDVAAKALYLAGQCLDIGRLQRFKEAMMLYKRCSDEYPHTDAGWRCLERYDLLRKRFEKVDESTHGMGN